MGHKWKTNVRYHVCNQAVKIRGNSLSHQVCSSVRRWDSSSSWWRRWEGKQQRLQMKLQYVEYLRIVTKWVYKISTKDFWCWFALHCRSNLPHIWAPSDNYCKCTHWPHIEQAKILQETLGFFFRNTQTFLHAGYCYSPSASLGPLVHQLVLPKAPVHHGNLALFWNSPPGDRQQWKMRDMETDMRYMGQIVKRYIYM